MKPKYLKSDGSSATEEEVRKSADALLQKHGVAGVAELVSEGRLNEEFPFEADFPPYDPKKARQKPSRLR